MSTYFPKGEIVRKWFVVDAEGQVLGRLATRVARILSGKNNPCCTPFLDTGDHVIVINAAKVKLTGLKADKKVYRRHTGYPGGLREEEFRKKHRAQAGANHPGCDSGHVAQVETGKGDGQQVEGLSRRQASALGAEAGGLSGQGLSDWLVQRPGESGPSGTGLAASSARAENLKQGSQERLSTLEKTSKWLKQFNTMERDAANRVSPVCFFVLAMVK